MRLCEKRNELTYIRVLLPSLPTWHTLPSELRRIPTYITTTACEDVELIGYTIDDAWPVNEEVVLEFLTPDLVDILQALHAICTQPRPIKANRSLQPISFARHAVRLALRAIQSHVDRNSAEASHGDVLQACLCIVVVVLGWESSYPILASSSAIEGCRAQARSLLSNHASFDLANVPRYRNCSEILFVWVLLMMGATSQETNEQSYYVNLFCAKFSHLAEKSINNLEDMDNMIGWPKQVFEKRVQLFWKLVQKRLGTTSL